MSSPAAPRPARRPWPKWVRITGWSVIGLLAAALGVYMATITFGAVHGIEFSPETFERRSYSFYELPLVGIQVTGIKHNDVTGAAESFLAAQKYVKVAPKPGDWHIIIGSRGPRLLRKGDASLLVQYLDATDAKEDTRWVKWSEDNPKLAKVFWPAVQQLARHELYVFLPDLFDLAKSHDDPVKLKQAADRLLADKLLFLATRLQDREEHAEAVKVLDEAVQLDPKNQKLARARQTAKVAAEAPAARPK